MSLDLIGGKIEELKNMMIAVATGGPKIQQINNEYTMKYQELADLLVMEGFENPNPHSDLWKWYGRWSSGDLTSWQSRREYISNMYEPLLKEVRERRFGASSKLNIEPTGWTRVDRGVDKIKAQLEKAKNEEDFQSVGFLCREALISLAQAVYNSDTHTTTDGVLPSQTDANRMLEAYIVKEISGSSNENARRVVKAALALANELQHRRTATFKEASLCAQSTFTVINLISIISGHLHQ